MISDFAILFPIQGITGHNHDTAIIEFLNPGCWCREKLLS